MKKQHAKSKEKMVSIPVDYDIYEKIKKLAKSHNRSFCRQASLFLEKGVSYLDNAENNIFSQKV